MADRRRRPGQRRRRRRGQADARRGRLRRAQLRDHDRADLGERQERRREVRAGLDRRRHRRRRGRRGRLPGRLPPGADHQRRRARRPTRSPPTPTCSSTRTRRTPTRRQALVAFTYWALTDGQALENGARLRAAARRGPAEGDRRAPQDHDGRRADLALTDSSSDCRSAPQLGSGRSAIPTSSRRAIPTTDARRGIDDRHPARELAHRASDRPRSPTGSSSWLTRLAAVAVVVLLVAIGIQLIAQSHAHVADVRRRRLRHRARPGTRSPPSTARCRSSSARSCPSLIALALRGADRHPDRDLPGRVRPGPARDARSPS